MDLANHLSEVPGIDMLVNLPDREHLWDIRIAEFIPRVGGEPKGKPERGVLCITSERLLFFLRVPSVIKDRELATATGYLVECVLKRTPLDRERAARYFPKKEAAVVGLRRRMAEIYLPDLLPVLSLPLAGVSALMPFMDSSQQACLDVEIDLRAEGGILRKLVHINPQLRFIMGPRYTEKPYLEPEPSLPLVSTCKIQELAEMVDKLRDAQAEIDYERLPSTLFPSPWALSLLSASPKAKVKLVHKGEQVNGKIFMEAGQLVLSRKLSKNPLFNLGQLDDLGWEEASTTLTLKGASMHYRIEGEARSAQFAWIRGYLEELLQTRRMLWEDPLGQGDLEPEAKPDPVGELLRYHLEPCNDPKIVLKDLLNTEQVDRFMDDFGQLLPPEESPQGLVVLGSGGDEGLLFTDRALYVRKRGQAGDRLPFSRVPAAAQSKKGFLSTSLSIGPLTFKLDSLGKETVKALAVVLRDIARLG